MTRWTVFEPPGTSGRGLDAVFVRDRFSIAAFLFGPFWLLGHRLWIEAAAAVLLYAGLGWLERSEGFALAGAVLPLLLAVLMGLEGPERRAARLRRLRWREAGVVLGADREEAELRYFGGLSERPAGELAAAPREGRSFGFGGFFGRGRAA